MKPVDELRPFLGEEYGCCDDAPVFGLPFRRHLQHTPLLPVLVPGVLRNQVGVVLVRLAVGGNRLVELSRIENDDGGLRVCLQLPGEVEG